MGNTREHIIVSSGTTATINLGGHTLGDNNGAASVIKNFGDLTLLNGTITSALGYGAIDNNSTGKLTVGTDARIVATGTRQAIYNDGKAEQSAGSRSREDSSPRLEVQPPWPSAARGGGTRPLVACGLV